MANIKANKRLFKAIDRAKYIKLKEMEYCKCTELEDKMEQRETIKQLMKEISKLS